MEKLLTITSKREGYTSDVMLHDDGHISFYGDMDIDCDGSGGNPHHDPYFQADTALHGPDGKPLHAEKVPFIVLPPDIINALPGRFLGAQSRITYRGRSCGTVVGDSGPLHKLGEASPAAAEAVGINGNPNTGGIEVTQEEVNKGHAVLYEVWPEVPAVVNGVTYSLKSFHG